MNDGVCVCLCVCVFAHTSAHVYVCICGIWYLVHTHAIHGCFFFYEIVPIYVEALINELLI